jgi:hypothetical protein
VAQAELYIMRHRAAQAGLYIMRHRAAQAVRRRLQSAGPRVQLVMIPYEIGGTRRDKNRTFPALTISPWFHSFLSPSREMCCSPYQAARCHFSVFSYELRALPGHIIRKLVLYVQ